MTSLPRDTDTTRVPPLSALRSWLARFEQGLVTTATALGERKLLLLVLAVATINGLLHVYLVPPWQHYDEPGHYEYVWLLVDRQRLPKPGEYDQAMRREALSSMIEHDFFRELGPPPNLLIQDKPLWLPFPQTTDRPFYYLLAALAVRPLRYADVITQLYAARLVSWALYLTSVLLAYALVSELVPRGHPLRLTVPGFMALLPAYTDLMTAVNNDVGAVVVFTLFLWGGVRLLVRGFSVARLIWVVGAVALGLWTKNTTAPGLLLLALLFVLALMRRAWTWHRLAAVPLAVLAAMPLIFSWGDAAYWYRYTGQELATRQRVSDAPVGAYALAIRMDPEDKRRRVINLLLDDQSEALTGRPVTLGLWMWASQPVQARLPGVGGTRWNRPPVELTQEPTFYAFTAEVVPNAKSVHVYLQPWVEQELNGPVTVYYDGLVLVEGKWPADQPPRFDGPDGRTGTWGGQPFVNLLRNPSGEEGWPLVRPWVVRTMRKLISPIPLGPFEMISLILDWERTGWIYRVTARRLLQTFWAVFGWGGVLIAPWWYRVLTWATVLGLVGALARAVRLAREPWAPGVKWALAFLGAAGLLVWGMVFMRPLPTILPWNPLLIPVARYAYPAIVPSALALVAGWTAWPWRRWRLWSTVVMVIALAVLNVVSLRRIVTFW